MAIYDEIGAYGVSAKGFLSELGALPEGTPVDLRLNSPGGSVFDAVAIHNALKRHAGPVTVWIDGIAASAASYIAMAGDEIVMPENAFLMIHDPAGLVMGTAEDMRAMAEALDKVKGSLVAGYAAKSGRSPEEVSALMASETWFDAADAMAQGFADRLVEPVRIAARFEISRFRNAPPVLVDAIETEPENDDDTEGASAEATDEADQVADSEDDQDATSDAPQLPAEAPPPSGAPPDPAAIRSEAIGHARAVIDLCRLAGQPQMAGRFLEQDANLEEVRAALLAAKAEAEPEIAPHHPQPGRSSAARPWGEIVARTFKPKG
ncbi:head maturation protease, ClpP-related [Plastorhodobacter daqingensis]|uniref:ATP-dependent Clp protease proteolytic subunit n=1 Tax=Plastorhodobacter daqingensis TaxID=1387281 RepID=A0ABW2UKE5_9RHOB